MTGPTELRVDLAAIAHNVSCVRERAGDRAVLVALKANAYGHGAVEVARHLESHALADWLGVAHVSEAQELRTAGIRLPILRLSHTFADELPAAMDAELSLTVVDEAAIREAETAAAAAGRTVQVYLKVDTGMGRLGRPPAHAAELARLVADCGHLELCGIMTHLPVSDVAEGQEFTQGQISGFERVCDHVREVVGEVPWTSAANSGAILMHDLGTTTMVRPGVMVYGCYPDATTDHTVELRPVATWTARLAFVKKVAAGDSVGYGRTWTAPRDTWVGTVSIGYGDGYSRLLSNRGRMLIDGVSHPIVGRVCMDQTMIDLGPVQPDVRVGDEVVVMGASGDEEITVAEIADLMGTITYEVTCLIAPRVRRIHSH